MANPSYYQTSRPIRSQVQHQEHIFHLYAHQHMGNTEFNIVPAPSHPNSFGWTNVMDWDVHDAPEIRAAVVARMQGVGISTRKNICKDLLDRQILGMKVIGQLWVGPESLYMHKVVAPIKGLTLLVVVG
nr:unnamed protein product [Digitaria exilis]